MAIRQIGLRNRKREAVAFGQLHHAEAHEHLVEEMGGAPNITPGSLIRLSVERRSVCQTRRMMSFTACIEKAEMCDAQARAAADISVAATWLELALHWRNLAQDGSDQVTFARLMSTRQPQG